VTPIEWVVLVFGIAAVAWVNWYFFFAERGAVVAGAPAEVGPGGVAEVTVVVSGGYSPATVRVRAGRPVRLLFDRQETAGCSEEVVFPDFGIRKFLPPLRKTAVELTPPRPGSYEFTCGMSMLRGRLVAIGDAEEG
jgi:plastocyanin domain-containing protein